MTPPTLLLLGGYGNTGCALAGLLLEHTGVHLRVAGRNGSKAQAEAAGWNSRYPGDRVRGLAADASDRRSLRAACEGAQWLIAASSTSGQAGIVAEVALEAGLDYMDPQFSRAKLAVLTSLAQRIETAGRCFVTDAGFHPGLPAALVRFAATQFEALHRARMGSVIQIDWASLEVSPATVDELVAEFRDFQSLHFEAGRWRSMGWLESFRPVWMDFDHGFGRRYTMPMFLEELRPLPASIPSLVETGFFVGGFNWFVDWILLPVIMGVLQIAPHRGAPAAGRLLLWGLKRFTPPPYGTLLRLEAQGSTAGVESRLVVTVFHPDGYLLTAAPMAACLMQLLDGSARRPGLHYQAWVVEPKRFLDDLQTMGVEVSVRREA